MASGSGKYTIVVDGILNDTKIRAQLSALQAQVNKGAIGGTGGKGSTSTVIQDVGKTADKTKKKIDNMNKGLLATQKASKGVGLGVLDVTKKVVAFGAVTSAIQLATQGIGSMVQNVNELDASLREYKKVSDLTGRGLEDFTKKAYEAGAATAKTGVEMIDAAT